MGGGGARLSGFCLQIIQFKKKKLRMGGGGGGRGEGGAGGGARESVLFLQRIQI